MAEGDSTTVAQREQAAFLDDPGLLHGVIPGALRHFWKRS